MLFRGKVAVREPQAQKARATYPFLLREASLTARHPETETLCRLAMKPTLHPSAGSTPGRIRRRLPRPAAKLKDAADALFCMGARNSSTIVRMPRAELESMPYGREIERV